MRIISGSAKGKRLATFSGRDIRPTPDRVRGAIFNILFSRLGSLEGKTVLDLFAGTGAMALEALSRGADRALLIDQGAQAAKIIAANLKACGLEEKASFLRANVPVALPRLTGRPPFDLIFLDPPYGKGMAEQIVGSLGELGLLAPGGIVCAEAGKNEPVADAAGGLVRIEERLYGSTSLHLFTYPETED